MTADWLRYLRTPWPVDFDIIRGMDFLSAFHITMVSGRFILSKQPAAVAGTGAG